MCASKRLDEKTRCPAKGGNTQKSVRSVWVKCHKIPGAAVLDRDKVPGQEGKEDRLNGIAISKRLRQAGGSRIGDPPIKPDKTGAMPATGMKRGVPLPTGEAGRQKGRDVLWKERERKRRRQAKRLSMQSLLFFACCSSPWAV